MTDSDKARAGLERVAAQAYVDEMNRIDNNGSGNAYQLADIETRSVARAIIAAFLDPSNRALALGAMGMEPRLEAECAEHLYRVARDVRAAGDAPLVRFTEDGIEDAGLSLADELVAVAMRLDFEGVMAMVRQDEGPDGPPLEPGQAPSPDAKEHE